MIRRYLTARIKLATALSTAASADVTPWPGFHYRSEP